jgi:hypothetical protein
MVASNFSVDRLFAPLTDLSSHYRSWLLAFPESEQSKMLHDNTCRIYDLEAQVMSEQQALIAFDAIADVLIADRKVLDGPSTEDRRRAETACLLAVDPYDRSAKRPPKKAGGLFPPIHPAGPDSSIVQIAEPLAQPRQPSSSHDKCCTRPSRARYYRTAIIGP